MPKARHKGRMDKHSRASGRPGKGKRRHLSTLERKRRSGKEAIPNQLVELATDAIRDGRTTVATFLAPFLSAQARSPNKRADLSASPSRPRSDDVGTSSTEACDPQTIAKAVKGYTCVVKTKSGSVAWRVEAVISTESRTFRVVKDLKSGLYVSDDMGKHSPQAAKEEKFWQATDYLNQRGNMTSV